MWIVTDFLILSIVWIATKDWVVGAIARSYDWLTEGRGYDEQIGGSDCIGCDG